MLVLNFNRDRFALSKIYHFLKHKQNSECIEYPNFLEMEKPRININPIKETPDRYIHILNQAVDELGIPKEGTEYDLYCPSLESKFGLAKFPYDTYLYR